MNSPPCPNFTLEPIKGRVPPICMTGSRPASSKICAIMPVVVVFPWVPATPMHLGLNSDIRPSSSSRLKTGTPNSRARFNSQLFSPIAAEYTTNSAFSTCAASCPIKTFIPISLSGARYLVWALSEPWIYLKPIFPSNTARPLMLQPPMAMKCITLSL